MASHPVVDDKDVIFGLVSDVLLVMVWLAELAALVAEVAFAVVILLVPLFGLLVVLAVPLTAVPVA